MKNFGILQHHNALKFPLSDASMNWPSFQSNNINELAYPPKKILQCSSFQFKQKSENDKIPYKLEKLCTLGCDHQQSKFLKYEKQHLVMILFTNFMDMVIFALSIVLPYICLNSQNPQQVYFSFLFPLTILEILLLIGKYVLKIFQRRQFKYQKFLKILIFFAALIIQSNLVYTIMSYYLLIKSSQVFKNFFTLIFKYLFLFIRKFMILKMIFLAAFHCHLFACLWGIHFSQTEQSLQSYYDAFYFSFQMCFFQEQDVNISGNYKNILITNFSFNLMLLIYFVFCINESQIVKKSIYNVGIYLYSPIIPFSNKLLLFHYFELFNQTELKEKQIDKLNNILEIIKLRVLEQEFKQFKFINVSLIKKISEQGQIYITKKLSTNLNGLYIVFSESMNISFMNESYQQTCSSRQIAQLSLIETLLNTDSNIFLHGQEVIYFFIEKKEFIDIFLDSPDKVSINKIKEHYHMIKDQIIFYNCTKSLGIRCYFCNLFHPSLKCSAFNAKARFSSEKTIQERNRSYLRKQNKKTKSAIFYQITNGGSSLNNQNQQEDNSDSFEAFSEFSSDLQISIQGLVQEGQAFKSQIVQMPSEKKLPKEQQLQMDFISDRMTEPIASSTLMRNLLTINSPGEIIRHPIQMQFQDFESIFDIDKWQEYNSYNTDYNLTNIIKKVNQ